MNDLAKNLLLWGVIFVLLMLAFQSFSNRSGAQPQLVYSDFLDQVKQGNIEEVKIEARTSPASSRTAPISPPSAPRPTTASPSCSRASTRPSTA